MPLVNLLVILHTVDLHTIFINDLVSHPGASRRSVALYLFCAWRQGRVLHILRLRFFPFLCLFRIKLPGHTVIQNRNSINRNRSFLVRITGPDANSALRSIHEPEIRHIPADRGILSWCHIVRLEGMGTAVRHFHSRFEDHPI